MIHINTYIKHLYEKKSVGIIFHYTSPESLVKILGGDRMRSGHQHISFSRNIDLKEWYSKYGGYCRIAFNGSDMSDKFRIEPYLFDPNKDPIFGGGLETSYENRKKWYGSEREEMIRSKEIRGVNKYIIQVDILEDRIKDHDQKYLAELEAEPIISLEIPINYVKKFEPVRGQMV